MDEKKRSLQIPKLVVAGTISDNMLDEAGAISNYLNLKHQLREYLAEEEDVKEKIKIKQDIDEIDEHLADELQHLKSLTEILKRYDGNIKAAKD
jgi:hypothetical protein